MRSWPSRQFRGFGASGQYGDAIMGIQPHWGVSELELELPPSVVLAGAHGVDLAPDQIREFLKVRFPSPTAASEK